MPPTEKTITPLLRRAYTTTHLNSGNSPVPSIQAHPVPNLPVMNELEQHAKSFLSGSKLNPHETAIVGAQHILETTSTLFQKFRNLEFEVYVTGKCYSTNPAVYQAMLNMGVHVLPGRIPEKLGEYEAANEKDILAVLQELEKNPIIKNIIFLDDGGRFFEKMPPHFRRKYRTVGVEQTRVGFYSDNVVESKIPIVNAAQSAAKLLLESPFIADAAVEQISFITCQLDKEKSVVGIIGFGSIGQALANKLIKDGFQVSVYDKDPETYKSYAHLSQIEIMPSIKQLYMHTNFIIGCTGQDTTESFDPLTLNGHNRIIASLTSEVKEFKSLLRSIAIQSPVLKVDPLATIVCYTKSGNIIEILYGGFPVNFAQSATVPFNVPALRIALTQAILFVSVMQAMELIENISMAGMSLASTNVMLHPLLQQKAVEIWYRTTIREENLPKEIIHKFLTDTNWIAQQSKGTPCPSEIFKNICTPSAPSNNVHPFRSKL